MSNYPTMAMFVESGSKQILTYLDGVESETHSIAAVSRRFGDVALAVCSDFTFLVKRSLILKVPLRLPARHSPDHLVKGAFQSPWGSTEFNSNTESGVMDAAIKTQDNQ